LLRLLTDRRRDHGDGSLIINIPEIHIESREIFCVRFEKDEVITGTVLMIHVMAHIICH